MGGPGPPFTTSLCVQGKSKVYDVMRKQKSCLTHNDTRGRFLKLFSEFLKPNSIYRVFTLEDGCEEGLFSKVWLAWYLVTKRH